MFCSKCGAENADDSDFCKQCGAPTGSAMPVATGSSTSLEPNVAGLLCYLFGWVSGLIFFLIEKEDQFVRFHAMQSIVVSVAVYIVCIPVAIVAFIFGLITPVLSMLLWTVFCLAIFGLIILLMYKAYQGERYKLPKIGDFAEKYI